ncbi:hypothetical protein IEQ34_000198 [Dendrobium chrysotoxum]|uniref:NB-ARC domain-containing protein n=1 Tax=Dendrobium chrysotoxum TaxID=161865 RepID=A0AAV7H8F9_DENCH|nr:hypothetical protein IEQ34_000198 [Dendrobium chrysotoxum]
MRKLQVLINGIDLYRNISLLSIVGHGGMTKTTLLQHVCGDEMIEEFDLKRQFHISISIDDCWRDSLKKLLGSPLEAKVIGGVLKDNLDERAFGNNFRKQFIWAEFYRFHLKTELYGSTKTSTKLFCILLHVSTRSTIW